MVKLSIIVPVYNVDSYLRKCVDSLIHQDIEDYEIILVDDGSTDNSPQICDEYVRAFEIGDCKLEIKCIHQPNGGLSAARNAGLAMARGEYICFVDSDDYWEGNVLGGLMEQIERDELDVLRFKYRNVNKHYEVFNPYKKCPYRDDDYSSEVTDGITFLNTRFGTACYAVMFIIKRSMLIKGLGDERMSGLEDDCLFTEGIYFEDTDWTPRMLLRAKRVASTDTIVYNYFVRQGSITNATNHERQHKALNDKMRLIGEMHKQAHELEQKRLSNVWFSRMIAATITSIIGIISSDFYNEKEVYLTQLKRMKVYPLAGRSIKTFIINLSPRLAVELLHLKNGK